VARPWLTAPGISGQGATIYPCSLLMLVPVLLKLSRTVQDMEHQANEAHKH
jgi:hypothetical protein